MPAEVVGGRPGSHRRHHPHGLLALVQSDVLGVTLGGLDHTLPTVLNESAAVRGNPPPAYRQPNYTLVRPTFSYFPPLPRTPVPPADPTPLTAASVSPIPLSGRIRFH